MHRRRATPGFFCKYVVDYLNEAGFSSELINRGGYTIRTTLDRNVLERDEGVARSPRCRRTQPNVANVMSVVQPGKDKHRVLGDGAPAARSGWTPTAEQTSYGLPYQPVNLGAGSVYKIFTAATALEKGLGINYQLTVPPSGYASPIYVDGGGRPLPVQNASDSYPRALSITDALATSPNTAFIKLEEFTGVPDVVDMAVRLGMRSLATTPFVDPATGQRTDRSIAEVTKAQKPGLVHPRREPDERAGAVERRRHARQRRHVVPAQPDRVDHRRGRQPGARSPRRPASRSSTPGLAEHDADRAEQGRPASGTSAARGRARWAGAGPMAGKTGTTQQHKSAAFVGVVPQMSGAVITFDNSNSPRPLCDGAGSPFACRSGNIFGGKTPAETWFGAMKPLLEGQPVLPLPPTDPRYVEGGAESRVPDVVGRGSNDARARSRAGRLDGVDPHGRQPRGPRHGHRAEPARYRAARASRSC